MTLMCYRRLVAAVILQAVRDTGHASSAYAHDAQRFLASPAARELAEAFDLPLRADVVLPRGVLRTHPFTRRRRRVVSPAAASAPKGGKETHPRQIDCSR